MAQKSLNEEAYAIGYGSHALARLDLQHFQLMEDLDGNLIDPSIPQTEPNLVIADLCCGPGTWVLQVSRRLPETVKLLALDINTIQLPPEAFLPKNVEVRKFDILAPPPEDLIGTLDIINIQIVFVLIDDEHIQPVLATILKLLKPGGYLQWSDDHTDGFETFSPDPNHQSKYLEACWSKGWELLGVKLATWSKTLGTHFSTAGFENVKVIERSGNPTLAKSFINMGFMGYEELAVSYKKRAGDSEEVKQNLKEYQDLIELARLEVAEHGVAAKLKVIRAVGRKPM